MSIGVYVALGACLLILLGVATWRMVTRNKVVPTTNNNVGKVNKELNQLAISLSAVYDLKVLYNILVRNRVAQRKFSLIPILVVQTDQIFLVTNLVKVKKRAVTINDNTAPFTEIRGLRHRVEGFDPKWYKEIEKFLKTLDAQLPPICKVVPILGDQTLLNNQTKNYAPVGLDEIGEFITNFPVNSLTTQNSNFNVAEFVTKLTKLNLLQKAARMNEKQLGRLMS